MLRMTSCLLILLLGSSAAAWDGVVVNDSAGQLRQEYFAAPSPSPGYCYWDKDAAGGPDFHATSPDGYGSTGCTDPWLVHCDGDSLVYRGSWPFIPANYITTAEYRVDLVCDITVLAPTRLSASRSVIGSLTVDEHTLLLDSKRLESLPILAPGSGPDNVQMDLSPGNYSITLHVDAKATKTGLTDLNSYQGSVVLKWEDPAGVAVESTSWSSLKAAFR